MEESAGSVWAPFHSGNYLLCVFESLLKKSRKHWEQLNQTWRGSETDRRRNQGWNEIETSRWAERTCDQRGQPTDPWDWGTSIRIKRWMRGWMDVWKDGWMDGWTLLIPNCEIHVLAVDMLHLSSKISNTTISCLFLFHNSIWLYLLCSVCDLKNQFYHKTKTMSVKWCFYSKWVQILLYISVCACFPNGLLDVSYLSDIRVISIFSSNSQIYSEISTFPKDVEYLPWS